MRLSRRTLLRGLGAGIALPVLDAMLDDRGLLHGIARAQGMPLPQRLLTYHFPVGTHMPDWTPSATAFPAGSRLTATGLPPNLTALGPVIQHVSVITGLRNQAALVLPIGPSGPTGGNHSRGTASLMTGVPVTLTGASGPSVDQVAATAFMGRTRMSSIAIAADPPRSPGAADGLTTAHQDNISWGTNGSQVPGYRDAHQLFVDLFGSGTMTGAEAARLARQRVSILDYVQDDLTRLNMRVGAADRMRIDEHLSSVRELEREVMFSAGASCTAPADPGNTSTLREDLHAQLMARLFVTALKCDIARTGSFQLRHGGANTAFPFLTPTITAGQHTISHDNTPTGYAEFQRVTKEWDIAMFAYLVQQMSMVTEGAGTMLDNVLLFCSSEITEGQRHNHDDMPILLAGRAGGVASGRHLMFPTTTGVNRLYLTMLQKVGIPATSFGRSTVPINPAQFQPPSGVMLSATTYEETTPLTL